MCDLWRLVVVSSVTNLVTIITITMSRPADLVTTIITNITIITISAIITITMIRPAILVANKADLVRSRVVSAGEGKQLAERFHLLITTFVIVILMLVMLFLMLKPRYSLTYLETSSGIGFNLDQLMVTFMITSMTMMTRMTRMMICR